VAAWNKRRLGLYRKGNDTHPDLSGAKFFGDKLNSIDFSRVDLRRCDLRSASLVGADLRGADLAETRFAGAFLMRAHFGWMVIRTDVHAGAVHWFPGL
jgi:uncharacterized protein YjbI with pentapeptide repeats